MTSRSDLERMISQTALGNHAEFQYLYKATSAKLFGICFRILNNQHEAEEALQETYVKIWRSADRFATGKASPISWLAAIARNTSIDKYRARKPETAGIEEAEVIADEAPSPEANVLHSDDMGRLRDCMLELDDRHALAVRQVYLNGWTYMEAADALQIPLNTAKTWIRRSLIGLRECMNRRADSHE
ncbi:MAG: sigma-70 family RNA polymerase sigma factor [Pseudomonadota bacterium]